MFYVAPVHNCQPHHLMAQCMETAVGNTPTFPATQIQFKTGPECRAVTQIQFVVSRLQCLSHHVHKGLSLQTYSLVETYISGHTAVGVNVTGRGKSYP